LFGVLGDGGWNRAGGALDPVEKNGEGERADQKKKAKEKRGDDEYFAPLAFEDGSGVDGDRSKKGHGV
jgi:hypothetical protein